MGLHQHDPIDVQLQEILKRVVNRIPAINAAYALGRKLFSRDHSPFSELLKQGTLAVGINMYVVCAFRRTRTSEETCRKVGLTVIVKDTSKLLQ